MKTRVLDSWPIYEWLNGKQPVAEAIRALISEAESGLARLLMSAINVGEVYYVLRKADQHAAAEDWHRKSAALPISIDVPGAEHIWAAADLKGKFPISYADAFAAELGQRYRCAVVTGDPEFRGIASLDLEWIGR